MATQIVTAYRLLDGHVVYLDAEGGWSNRIDASRIATTEEAGAELMKAAEAAAADRIVFTPYLVDVVHEDGAVRPVLYRETIRARGPSVHPQFGNQAEPAGG